MRARSWSSKTFGDVLQPTGIIDPQRYPAREFDYIDVSSVSNQTLRIEQTQRLLGKDAPSRARRLVRANDVLFATIRPTLKRVAIVPSHLDGQVCSTGYFVLRVKAGVDYRFVFYALLTDKFIGSMAELQKGASYPAVTDADVRAQPIMLPSLSEQQRIGDMLDEAFAGIAAARANAERNLRNARALFASRLASVFAQGGEGWADVPLARLCTLFADGDWIETKDQSPTGVRLVQTGNVGVGVFKDRGERARYVSEATFKRLRCTEIFPGDCLISRLPDPVGRSCTLPDTGERMITAVDCTIVRFTPRDVLPEYFNLYSQSSAYLRAVDAATTGTTRKRISRGNLGQVRIPVAPFSDQHRIVSVLSELGNEVQHLETLYQRKLAALDELKQSLLHHAFTGQLTERTAAALGA